MIETKFFCDKCKKEIKCIPPGPDSSVITIEGEKHVRAVKGPGFFFLHLKNVPSLMRVLILQKLCFAMIVAYYLKNIWMLFGRNNS